MKFTSTRNNLLNVSFSQAVRDCIPEDGGVFVPSEIEDLRRWIYYIDESTSFSSIAGSLTSALIKDEFSPIICETIATNAFPFEPKVRQLDDQLFLMELYHGYTGNHRDFGISYLCSYLEYTLQLNGGKAVFLDYTNGSLGSVLAKALRGKKNLKSVLVYEKGTVRGLEAEDLIWNGGNILPVEVEASESEIKKLLAEIFKDKAFVQEKNVTVANTTNVCRLLGQICFFPYSFAQIKNKVCGDIYYAMDAGSYGPLITGLYSWRFALPVSGFILPSTAALHCNAMGNPEVIDSFVNINQRGNTDPINPANLERLENFFADNELMMRNFVFPGEVSERQREIAAKELFKKYGVFADPGTAKAYASALEHKDIFEDEGSVVIMADNHPALSSDYCRHVIGEVPEMPENIKVTLRPVHLNRPVITSAEELKQLIKDMGL